MYLGLAERHQDDDGVNFQLTTLGRKIMKMDARSRNLAIIGRIFQHDVFYKTFALHQQQLKMPTSQQIVAIMKQSGIVGLDPDKTTVARRASTVAGWIRWIFELTRL